MPLAEAEKWLDHLTSCSPCYGDFKGFRQAFERQRRQRWVAAAASILVAAGVIGWALIHKRNETPIAQTAVLDLRDRSPARGIDVSPNEQPLVVSRKALRMRILLPLGSREGSYDVRISAISGEEFSLGSAITEYSNQIMSIHVAFQPDSLPRGKCFLRIRRAGLEWESYALLVQ
jgi:hypothetical protein